MEKLFAAFERIDEKNSRDIEGTGLGLNIAKVMLQLMDSDLHVESTFGQGSRFFFTLPLEIVDAAPIGTFSVMDNSKLEEPKKENELIHNPDLRILTVDDNMVNLKVFEGLLKKYLEIGFDDVCFKPAKQQELNSLLIKWTTSARGTATCISSTISS